MNSRLASMESQLTSLESLTASYRVDLRNKEEKWQRLQEALADLADNKSDFLASNEKCLQPECTPNTLHGSNEKHLDEFREEALRTSFLAIPNEAIREAEEIIQEKMEQLQQEILSLESNISSSETQHTRLFAKKMEVKNNS